MKKLHLVAALLLAAPIAFVSPTAFAAAPAHDNLVIGVTQFPSGMHPSMDPESIKGYALGFALRSITAYDKTWHNTCLMCETLPTIENGLAKIEQRPGQKPGMVMTLTLKDGLSWGDGTPVTTADLVFTMKLRRDPNAGFSNTRSTIDRVDVTDARTATVHFDQVDAQYNELPTLLPAHLETSVHDAATQPGEYGRTTLYNRAPTTPGLYNGPYLVTDFQTGAQIVLEPNPHWHGTRPGFKRIVLRTIANTAALQSNLLSGDVDMAAGENIGLTVDQAIGMQAQYPDRFTYIFQPSLSYEQITPQLDNPILADIRVRRALLMSIDRQLLVKRLFGGKPTVAATMINPLHPMFTAETAGYPYDPVAARAMLAEAGWTPGPDGICRNAAGARLSLDFATTAGNRVRELQQQVMQSQWKAVCVEAVIRNEMPRALFGETLKHRQFSGLAMFAWVSSLGASPRQTLGSDQVPTAANSFGGSNYGDYHNDAFDAEILTVESELDPAQQRQTWAKLQRMFADDLPQLPLWFTVQPHVIPKWLRGYAPTGHVDYSSKWAEDWHPDPGP
jgi:peptide/nickel transport system substrate-binding protein